MKQKTLHTLNLSKWILLSALFCFSMISCQDKQDDDPNPESYGFIHIELVLDVTKESALRTSSIETDSFDVHVINSSNDTVVSYANFVDVPQQIKLATGTYYVVVESGPAPGVGFDLPHYRGVTDTFTLENGDVEELTIDIKLANVKVSIDYSTSVKADFTDWNTTVSGTSDSLIFVKGETRSGYFPAAEDLTVRANLTFQELDLTNGTRSISAIIQNTLPNDHFQLTIDYKLEFGTATFLGIDISNTNDIPIFISSNDSLNKTYGGTSLDELMGASPTKDGGYIMAGRIAAGGGDISTFKGERDTWVVKVDGSGSIEWEKTLGGSGLEINTSIIEVSDGGYLVGTSTPSTDGDISGNKGGNDIWMTKLDANGNLIWEKSYGGSNSDNFTGSVQNTDSTYIIIGTTSSSDGDISTLPGSGSVWIVCIAIDGAIKWEKTIGGLDTTSPRSVCTNSEGGVAFCGVKSFSAAPSNAEAWLVNLDGQGNILLDKTYGGSAFDEFRGITQADNGDFVLCGYSQSNDGDLTKNNGDSDLWVVRTDVSGSVLWQKTFGGTNTDIGQFVQETRAGNIVIEGYTNSNDLDIDTKTTFDSDAWVLLLENDGDLIWKNTFGGSGTEWSNGFVYEVYGDGYVLLTQTSSSDGDSPGTNGTTDFWAYKINSNGNL